MVHLLPYYQVDSFSTNHWNTRSKKMSTPSAPFANDKHYRNKSSVFGPRNKIRGANE